MHSRSVGYSLLIQLPSGMVLAKMEISRGTGTRRIRGAPAGECRRRLPRNTGLNTPTPDPHRVFRSCNSRRRGFSTELHFYRRSQITPAQCYSEISHLPVSNKTGACNWNRRYYYTAPECRLIEPHRSHPQIRAHPTTPASAPPSKHRSHSTIVLLYSFTSWNLRIVVCALLKARSSISMFRNLSEYLRSSVRGWLKRSVSEWTKPRLGLTAHQPRQ